MRKCVLVPLLFAGGCASSGIQPLRAYEIATAPYHEEVKESAVGSLMYEGGCLLFKAEDGARWLPIWPNGTRFEESLVTFHQPAKADQRLVIGEEVRLDGARSTWPAVLGYERFQHQCGAEPFFVAGVAPAN